MVNRAPKMADLASNLVQSGLDWLDLGAPGELVNWLARFGCPSEVYRTPSNVKWYQSYPKSTKN